MFPSFLRGFSKPVARNHLYSKFLTHPSKGPYGLVVVCLAGKKCTISNLLLEKFLNETIVKLRDSRCTRSRLGCFLISSEFD